MENIYHTLEPKIHHILKRKTELESTMADPELPSNPSKYKTLIQEHNHLIKLEDTHTKYLQIITSIQDTEVLIKSSEDDMLALAQEELQSLTQESESLLLTLRELVIPPSPLDSKSVIMEIRAGTGGEEAALFVADLYRMYIRYAESQKLKHEIINANETGIGGYKEIIFFIGGSSYGVFKYESGVHRVQRIPTTESSGRIHTSAVTVAVLPEIKETEIEIKNEDLRIDVFRSSGPGGQSVNTTDSAVRITHVPTGTTVSCQDEKSQHKNKAKALRILRSRIIAIEEEKKQLERAKERKKQIGSGDRSERIRTYNYPQNRVTDHRISLTLYQLDKILEGNLKELLSAVNIGLNE